MIVICSHNVSLLVGKRKLDCMTSDSKYNERMEFHTNKGRVGIIYQPLNTTHKYDRTYLLLNLVQ